MRTEKGEKWVVPVKILENESEIGGDLHRQILIKTIEYLHESNMFVMATPEPESFDLIAYAVDAKRNSCEMIKIGRLTKYRQQQGRTLFWQIGIKRINTKYR